MSKCALLYFVIGVTLTTASYAFFGQMMQMPGKSDAYAPTKHGTIATTMHLYV